MTAITMKAIQQHAFGGPDVLVYEDAPMPEPKRGEVLVRVHAVGLNPPDFHLREGYKALPPEWRPVVAFPMILGTDISGVVEALADDVTAFSVGDEVYSMVRFPTGMMGDTRAYAEFVSVPASDLALKPAGLSHPEAAGAPMSLLTAWQFLVERGHDDPNPLQPTLHHPVPLAGRTVLVNGAAGGVGHFAVQIAKWQGARVIAVGSGKQEALLRDLGADEVINYETTAAETVARDIDLVLDAVGGPSAARFLPVIKPGGGLFLVFPLGFASAEEAAKRGVTVSTTQVRSSGSQLTELASLLGDGVVRVVIDSEFALAEAGKAHERAAQGGLQGKIVLTVA